MRKLKISILCVCLAFLLSACGADGVNAENSIEENRENSAEENTEKNAENSAEDNIEQGGDAAEDAPALPDEGPDAVSDEPSDRYRAVLSGEENFVAVDFRDGDRSVNIENIKEIVSDEDWLTAEVTKFTILDLDEDGDKEVVLWIEIKPADSDWQFEILYFQDQEVYGFSMPARGLASLKADGTFYYWGGIDNSGIGRLRLLERGYVQEEMPDQQHQDEKEDARWYDLTPEGVELAFENEFAEGN
ncbi:MAG: hypothetical protein NC123_10320 [Butyrivibrio sp.]|nr:hypothetical protein [Acetatifactor muris]MCM1559925.1 hypothetical protein [Butyrivibrio sp.]